MEEIQFEFTKEDFEKAGGYYDTQNCGLAQLGKKIFPGEKISAGGVTLGIILKQDKGKIGDIVESEVKVFNVLFETGINICHIYRDPSLLPAKGVLVESGIQEMRINKQ